MNPALAFEDLDDVEKHSVNTLRPPANSIVRLAIPGMHANTSAVDAEWDSLIAERLPENKPPREFRDTERPESEVTPTLRPVEQAPALRPVEQAPVSRPAFPRMHVHYAAKYVSVTFELPGFEPGDIALTVEPEVITLQAERHDDVPKAARVVSRERPAGGFRRTLKLLHRVDPKRVYARVHAGLLVVEMAHAGAERPVAVREI
ncbi:MAG: Hsp20/alpha crystallin family protein [Polyangiaceae bacterium]